MNTVYFFNRNYDHGEEKYADHTEALNRAKQMSLRNFSILNNANGKVFFYEQGELCNKKRAQELAKTAEDIIVRKIEKEHVAPFRGKRRPPRKQK